MSWVEDGRALRRSVPGADGLARLAEDLGESVVAEEPLHGGVASSTWRLSTPTRQLVLKRFRGDDGAAAGEWERLHAAAAAPVATPTPVALDADGRWFGTPALVVTHLDGRSMHPADPEALGRTLAAIHRTPIPDPAPPVLSAAPLWERWEHAIEYPDGVVDAIRELQSVAGSLPRVFSHCDFHPGNVLVDGDGVVTGVIDWNGCRLVPRGFDVALLRCDLAIAPGGDAADRALAAYEDAAGERIALLPLFDALAAARALEWGHGWVEAWTDAGIPMTAERIRDAATEFARAAVS